MSVPIISVRDLSKAYNVYDRPRDILLEALFGLLLGCGSSGLIAFAPLMYPTAVRSTGVGWAMGMGRFGSFVGPLIVGAMLARQEMKCAVREIVNSVESLELAVPADQLDMTGTMVILRGLGSLPVRLRRRVDS